MTTVTEAPAVSSKTGVRIAGWAGVLWAVLSFARLPLTGEAEQPARAAASGDIVGFFEGVGYDGLFVVGMGLVTVGWALLPVFIARVADLIGHSDARLRWVGQLALAGAILELGLTVTYLAALTTGVFAASHTGLGSDGYVLLHGMTWSLLWLDSILFALWVLPLGTAIVVTRLFPRWLGWALVATGVGGVVAFFIPNDVLVNVFGAVPYLLVLIAGVLMLVRSERYSQL
jgi:Domain of unknown function (DUF4386)